MITRRSWLSLLTLAAILLGPFAITPQASQAQTEQTYIVDNNGDAAAPGGATAYCTAGTANDCSLRQAITKANTDSAISKIIFDPLVFDPVNPLPDRTILIVDPNTGLPPLTDSLPTTIDGVVDTFNSNPTQVAINGNGSLRNGLTIRSSGNIIQGLSVYGFICSNNGAGGIVVDGLNIAGGVSNNVIQRNYIGLDLNGDPPPSNERNCNGVALRYGANTNTVTSNVISGNALSGVYIEGGNGNIITANRIGVRPDQTPAANGLFGVELNALSGATNTNNRIGGPLSADRNIISSNGTTVAANAGILLIGEGTTGNTISGNYIGLRSNGSTLAGNIGDGILIKDGARQNTLSGSLAAPLVVSANQGNGIRITGSGTISNTITSVYIGTTSTGGGIAGNTLNGILVDGGAQNTSISGNPTNRMLIAGNSQAGVVIRGIDTRDTEIVAAYIGIVPNPSATSQTFQIANAGGVLIDQARESFLSGNWITSNSQYGVRLTQADSTTLQGNYIGLNVARDIAPGNSGPGVDVQNSTNTLIGGPTLDEANYIAGNATAGVQIGGTDTVSTTVDSNYIGLALDTSNSQFSAAAGNSGPAVLLNAGPRQTTIGGAGNTIAANSGPGVQISATLPATVTLATVLGNAIGFVPNPNPALDPIERPNADGVAIEGDGISNIDVLSNTIRFNSGDGIRVTAATTVTLRYNGAISDNGANGVHVAQAARLVNIRDNTIRANNAAAILLADPGTEQVTMIDNQIAANTEPVTLAGTTIYTGTPPDTAEPGPNHDIDPPFDLRVSRNGLISGFVYSGTLDLDGEATPPSACIDCRIAVYQSDPDLADGQPWTRLNFEGGADLVPADDGSFSGQLSGPVPTSGQLLFAATDGDGNTSAFAVFQVIPELTLTPLEPPSGAQNAIPSRAVTYTLRLENTGTLDLPSILLFTGDTLEGWQPAITPTGAALAAGASRTVTVTLQLPVGTDPNAAAGIIDTTVVTASVPGLITETARLTTTVLEQAVLRVQPVRSEGRAGPDQLVTYAHRLFNDGNITVTVNLDYFTEDAAGSTIWNDNTTISTNTLTLIPGEFRDIAVNVTVPTAGQVGAQATTYITATLVGYPDQTRYISDTTIVDLNLVATMAADEVQPGVAGGEVIFFHTISNVSNGVASFTLNSQTNYNSTVTFESDTPGVTINPASNTFTLDNVLDPPLRNNELRLKVTVKLDERLLPGEQEVINIFLTDPETNASIGGAAVVDRVNITRGAVAPRLWLPMISR